MLCNIITISVLILLLVALFYLFNNFRNQEGFQSIVMRNPVLEMNPQTGRVNNRYIINSNTNYLNNIISNFDISNYDIDSTNRKKYLSVYQHSGLNIGDVNYKPMGQCIFVSDTQMGNSDQDMQRIMNENESLHLLSSSNVHPDKYELIWHSGKLNSFSGSIFSIWRPVAPDGYTCLGDILVRGMTSPPVDIISCMPMRDSVSIKMNNGKLWDYKSNFITSKNLSDEEVEEYRAGLIMSKIEDLDDEEEGIDDNEKQKIIDDINKSVQDMTVQQLIEELNLNNDEPSSDDLTCYSVSSHNYFKCSNTGTNMNDIFDIDRSNLSRTHTQDSEEILSVSLGSV